MKDHIVQLLSASEKLASLLTKATSQLGTVSADIENLDRLQERVHATLKLAQTRQQLKNCAGDIKSFTEAENFEEAAKLLTQYQAIPSPETHSSLDAASLESAASALMAALNDHLEAALKHENFAEIDRFLLLHSQVGHGQQAFTAIKTHAIHSIRSAAKPQDKDSPSGLSSDLTRIFETVAAAVNDYSGGILEAMGASHVIQFLNQLQRECDQFAQSLISSFATTYRLVQRQKELDAELNIGTESFFSAFVSPTPTVVSQADPRDLDHLLAEIATVCSRAAKYEKFMRQYAASVVTQLEAGKQILEAFPCQTGLMRGVQELISFAAAAERYFLFASVGKATKIDSYPPEPSLVLGEFEASSAPVSTVVEDVFYIVGKSLKRALASQHADNLCAALQNAATVVDNAFCQHESRRLSEFGSSAYSGVVGSQLVGGHCRSQYLVTLNNLDAAVEYLNKLRSEVNSLTKEIFSEMDLMKISPSLEEMGTATATSGVQQLSNSLSQRVRVALDRYMLFSYELSDAGYADCDVNDPFALSASSSIEAFLEPLEPLLATGVMNVLMEQTAVAVSKMLVEITWRKKFTALERDIRTISSAISRHATKSFREPFTRITQMATILSLLNVNEMSDYWKSDVQWKLSAAEVRRTLSLRPDFTQQSVASLKL